VAIERFISYPNASPDSDGSLLLGWDSDRIRPLVEGLAEVMPWVRQWHNEVDPNFGQNPSTYQALLSFIT